MNIHGVFVTLTMLGPWVGFLARVPSYRGAFGWLRGGHVSVAILIAMLIAASYTIPFSTGLIARAPVWQIPSGGPVLREGLRLPVFCQTREGPEIRCGVANARGAQIAFAPYGRQSDPKTVIPVLASADIGLLWALADPAARTKIRGSAADLVRQTIGRLRDITGSDTWQRGNRRAVLERAIQHAWQAEDTARALRAFLRAGKPVMGDAIANEIGPLVAPYVAEAFWRMVKTTSAQMWSMITGNALDLSAIGTSVIAALQDRDVQTAIGRLGPRLMELPQTVVLFERLAANMADALQRDPEMIELLAQAAMDPRVRTELGQIPANAGRFLHDFGRVLWKLGDNRSLNSLAGMSVKTMLLGVSQPLILLLDPDDAVALVQILPGHAVLLVPAVAR